MKIIDGWNYKEFKRDNIDTIKTPDGRRYERFHIGHVTCFTWLADPNKVWAYYGTTRNMSTVFEYLNTCIKDSEYDFKIPTPEDLRVYKENEGFHSYFNEKNISSRGLDLNEIWDSECSDDGKNRHLIYLLKTEDL